MAQSTTNLGKIHVFPSETLYNQFKDIIADNDLALLKDDGAYIVAALLEQNGYVKFSNGLILQWGMWSGAYQIGTTITFPIAFGVCYSVCVTSIHNSTGSSYCDYIDRVLSYTNTDVNIYVNTSSFFWMALGKA